MIMNYLKEFNLSFRRQVAYTITPNYRDKIKICENITF